MRDASCVFHPLSPEEIDAVFGAFYTPAEAEDDMLYHMKSPHNYKEGEYDPMVSGWTKNFGNGGPYWYWINTAKLELDSLVRGGEGSS